MGSYYYLAGALPALKWDEKPPLKIDEFLAFAAEQMSDGDYKLVRASTQVPADAKLKLSHAAGKFAAWERELRNAIVRMRAGNSPDKLAFLRAGSGDYPEMPFIAQEAANRSNPLEREKFLDKTRWSKLEELELGHWADADFFCIYRLKLELLEKYRDRDAERGDRALEALVNDVSNHQSSISHSIR